ncbi:Mrp/NBP35 family ATP-binding protein [Nocardia sp. CC213A]|uniref:Mrp/NBP35 family ATP-binding protein n=1 Tax=Nocardia sp. CC213A TaxID=3044157 RepID=UPI003558E470
MAAVMHALAEVRDPEINRPITELDMVAAIDIAPGNRVGVRVLLTVAGCPMRARITADIEAAVRSVPDVTTVTVDVGVMSDAQRAALRQRLRGTDEAPVIPFAQPGNRTRVYALASGKGGVGKSSVTVNLACVLARRGLRVGILDADIHGHSIPSMMGTSAAPTQVDRMLMPPTAHGVRIMSIAMFVTGNEPVIWRGPMLHRVLHQFLADVYWSDLDILLIDLPPGTGDIAISLAQLLPTAEMLIVTTPQHTAARIAERAGAVGVQTGQRVAGVVENMSWYEGSDGARHLLFGSGGAEEVSARLSDILGTDCPVLARIPLDPDVCTAGDDGTPMVLTHPDSAAAQAISALADHLHVHRTRLAGRRLAVAPG